MTPSDLLAVLVAGLACGGLALATPAVLRRLPEPERDPSEEPKVPYAAIADLPRLRVGAAVTAAVVAAALAWRLGPTWSLVVLAVLVPPGVALAVVDWRTRLLPTRIIAPTYVVLVPVVLLSRVVTGEWDGVVGAWWGWLAAGGFFLVLWLVSPSSLGYGDVRLSGLLGLSLGHLGWGPLLLGLWSGFVLMGVVGLALRRFGAERRRTYPFGPFMLLGALVGVLGQPLVVPALA